MARNPAADQSGDNGVVDDDTEKDATIRVERRAISGPGYDCTKSRPKDPALIEHRSMGAGTVVRGDVARLRQRWRRTHTS